MARSLPEVSGNSRGQKQRMREIQRILTIPARNVARRIAALETLTKCAQDDFTSPPLEAPVQLETLRWDHCGYCSLGLDDFDAGLCGCRNDGCRRVAAQTLECEFPGYFTGRIEDQDPIWRVSGLPPEKSLKHHSSSPFLKEFEALAHLDGRALGPWQSVGLLPQRQALSSPHQCRSKSNRRATQTDRSRLRRSQRGGRTLEVRSAVCRLHAARRRSYLFHRFNKWLGHPAQGRADVVWATAMCIRSAEILSGECGKSGGKQSRFH
mgnify:CR=1 FL=1